MKQAAEALRTLVGKVRRQGTGTDKNVDRAVERAVRRIRATKTNN